MRCAKCQTQKAKFIDSNSGVYYCSVSCQVAQYTSLIGVRGKRPLEECDNWDKVVVVPISQIICGQFRVGQDWSKVLAGIECTQIGSRVARSLIRVAATRIFSTPEQSILEPIVNSLDAYFPNNRTGKFGMGFFSLLYWVVVGQGKARLTITSTYKLDNDSLCAYKAVIFLEQNEVLMIRLEDQEPEKTTGTSVSLKMEMNSKMLEGFSFQLQKLRFVRSAPIFLNSRTLNAYSGSIDPETPSVMVYLGGFDSGFDVIDHATGISREVLLSSLLVPTISTKTIQMAESTKKTTQWVSHPGVRQSVKANHDTFVLLVNSIAVVILKSHSPLSSPHHFLLTLDLPPWTKIPVSRDDVLLSSIPDIFKQVVKQTSDILAKEFKTIVPIEHALEQWALETSSDENRAIIRDALDYIRTPLRRMLVDYRYESEYASISELMNYCTSLTWHPEEVEHELRSKHQVDDRYFINRSVIFYRSPNTGEMPFFAGLPSLLFVESAYAEQELWTQKLQTSMYSTTLFLRLEHITVQPADSAQRSLITNNSELSEETRTLLLQILDQEATVVRNGWIIKKAEQSASRYLKLISYKLISNDLLRFFFLHWYPVFIQGPGKYVYGRKQKPTYRLFPKFEKIKIRHLTSLEPSLILPYPPADLYEKALRFATESIITVLQQNLKEYSNLLSIDLEFVGFGSRFGPLDSLVLLQQSSMLFGNLFRDLIMICNTSQEFYWCQVVLLYMENEIVSRFSAGSRRKNEWILEWFESSFYKSNQQDVARILVNMIRSHFHNRPRYEAFKSARGYIIDYFIEFKNADANILGEAFLSILKDIAHREPEYRLPRIQPKPGSVEFTLNEFIARSFQHEWPQEDPAAFFQTLERESKTPPTVALATQMIEIVVNEGTTKDVVQAQLTETLQNSRDAMIQFGSAEQHIDVRIYARGNQLVLSVKDFVGIDVAGIIALSIPFYSNKSVSEVLAGEMGTGFFNLYRSDSVFIKTSRRGHVFRIYDVPLKDATTHRVLDVHRFMHYKYSPDQPDGTTITVLTTYPLMHELVLALSSAKDFTTQVMGLMRFPFENAYVTLNDTPITKNLALVKKTPSFEIYKLADTTDTSFTSYVLTKGVPFQSLKQFIQLLKADLVDMLDDLMGRNYVLNILPGAYTPVQTRTKLGMSEKIKQSIILFLLECAYEIILNVPVTERDKYFQFYNEKDGVDAEQVMPHVIKWNIGDEVGDFAMHNSYYNHFASFSQILEYVIDSYKKGVEKGLYTPGFEQVRQMPLKVQKTRFEFPVYAGEVQPTPMYNLLLEIIYGWLNGKRVQTKEELAWGAPCFDY
jgi:hypothetical protein